MSILKFKDIAIILNIDPKYKAHTSPDGQNKETLKAHIDLVFVYFLKLMEQNRLEPLLDKLFIKSAALLEGSIAKEPFGDFVKYIFAKAIYWHDMGKMNPNFQVEKMDNSNFSNLELSEGSNHSLLGAYLFINHSLQELYGKNWDEDDIEIIEAIVYLFGYTISRHHGALYDNCGLDFQGDLSVFLKEFEISSAYTENNKNENRVFSAIYDYIEQNKEILFLLSKSLFSLLIISDYYATAQFMNYGDVDELKYNDFGLIDERFRQKIYTEFYIDKFDQDGKQITFNQQLKDKTNADFKSFEELQDKSNDNLNHLRNKLFVEIRTNLQNTLQIDQNQNLFYIEAPTGAGKTNLSIMSAVEIVKKDESINKIVYVFPFTTLITQTYESIAKVLNLGSSEIVQLHSKAPYNQKEPEQDGVYGDAKTNFLDNQFINYPVTLLSHVKFFDVLTGTSKDDNYIFHRLANSIVVIDEIQTYNPDLWSKIVYLLDVMSKNFNIKFIVMSATLPKIGNIIDSQFAFLVSNKKAYFKNPNFAGRVEIDTNVIKIKNPADIYEKLENESKKYLQKSENKKVKTIIEFITKKGADEFYKDSKKQNKIFDEIFILSGTILEPRRKEIIDFLKTNDDKNVLLVTTQVVEAGVDIDMDIGFKEKSLVDSDEQLAGRINRNSKKNDNKLFLFELEKPKANFVYKGDKRLDVQVKEDVLKTKDFDKFYDEVISKIQNQNNTSFIENLNTYIDHIKNLRFSETHVKIIDMDSISVFVPIDDEAKQVWLEYTNAIKNEEQDLIDKKVNIKTLSAKISKYTFSLAKYQGSGIEYLKSYGKEEYGYLYLEKWDTKIDDKKLYTYEDGLETSILSGSFVPMIF